MVHVIIATDSRGRLLEHFLRDSEALRGQCTISTILSSGCKISGLKESILSAIKTFNCDHEDIYVILFAGICNLTAQIKSYHNTLHYNNKTINGERKPDEITEEIDDLYLALCTSFKNCNNTTS